MEESRFTVIQRPIQIKETQMAQQWVNTRTRISRYTDPIVAYLIGGLVVYAVVVAISKWLISPISRADARLAENAGALISILYVSISCIREIRKEHRWISWSDQQSAEVSLDIQNGLVTAFNVKPLDVVAIEDGDGNTYCFRVGVELAVLIHRPPQFLARSADFPNRDFEIAILPKSKRPVGFTCRGEPMQPSNAYPTREEGFVHLEFEPFKDIHWDDIQAGSMRL